MPTTGTCVLCQRDAAELRDSHIISEFLYEMMYDDKHRFRVISVDEEYPWLEQKGYRERLLCQGCETKLSVWEGYANALLSGKIQLRFDRSQQGITWAHGIDYSRFKLFQLSILWRAGVSKHPFFANVKLGPHAEQLRRMLLEEDPGPPERYGCLIHQVKYQGHPADVIIQPTKTRLFSTAAYRFLFGSLFWAYTVASHALPKGFCAALLQRDGTMAMAPPKNLEDAPFFREFISRV